jgi:hypothetical protein
MPANKILQAFFISDPESDSQNKPYQAPVKQK